MPRVYSMTWEENRSLIFITIRDHKVETFSLRGTTPMPVDMMVQPLQPAGSPAFRGGKRCGRRARELPNDKRHRGPTSGSQCLTKNLPDQIVYRLAEHAQGILIVVKG